MTRALRSPYAPITIALIFIATSLLARFTPLLPDLDSIRIHQVALAALLVSTIFMYFIPTLMLVQAPILLAALVGHILVLALPTWGDELGIWGALALLSLAACAPGNLVLNLRAGLFGRIDGWQIHEWLLSERPLLVLRMQALRQKAGYGEDSILYHLAPKPGFQPIDVSSGNAHHTTDMHDAGLAIQEAVRGFVGARVLVDSRTIALRSQGEPTAHQKLALAKAPARAPRHARLACYSAHSTLALVLMLSAMAIGVLCFIATGMRHQHTYTTWVQEAFTQALQEPPITLDAADVAWLHERGTGGRAHPAPGVAGEYFLVCVDTPTGVFSYATHYQPSAPTMQRAPKNTNAIVFDASICTR